MPKTFFEQMQELVQDSDPVDYTSFEPARPPFTDARGPVRAGAARYQKVSYLDHLSSTPEPFPASLLDLPGGIVPQADAETEPDAQAFVLDVLIYIQGIEVSDFMSGGISISHNTIEGQNRVTFTLDNEDDRFVWTERNLEALFRKDRPKTSAFLNPHENIKQQMLVYKADPTRNPRIRSAKNTPVFARFDLSPNRAIFSRMDPIRVFSLYPYRAPTQRTRLGGQENIGALWMPQFVGYVEQVSIEDDDLTGSSKVTIEATDIVQSIMHRMRISSDPVTGISNPLDALGFALPKYTNLQGDQGRVGVDSPQKLVGAEVSARDRFFDPKSTVFYDQVMGSIYNQQFYPNQPMEGVVKQLVVFKPSGRPDGFGNEGIRNIEYGGTFTYDSASQNRQASSDFLAAWHSFCLFGPKRRPWTQREVEAVGSLTTTDGDFSPNNVRLWFLLPEGGSGPRNVADLSSVGAAMSHEVNWTNRAEVLRGIVETIDYRMMVAPTGDLICEFPFADFRPEDFGEYKTVFRVDKGLRSSSFGDEQESPAAAVIVTTGLAPGAGGFDGDDAKLAESVYQTHIVYSPYIAARYGMEVEPPISMNFLQLKDKDIAQQRAVIEFQKRNARCNSLGMSFTYRPFLLPNRPMHHLRRTRMGTTVSIDTSFDIASASGEVSAGLENVRIWSGYYRSDEDFLFTKLDPLQTTELQAAGVTTPEQAKGIDAAASKPDSPRTIEQQVFSTIMAGESTPVSARVGWGTESMLAPASGVYVLDPRLMLNARKKLAELQKNAAPGDGLPANQVGAPAEATGTGNRVDDHTFAHDPLRSMVRTSPYGERHDPFTGATKMHEGIDFAAVEGTPLFAVDKGTIHEATLGHPANGNFIRLVTDDGYQAVYLHMTDLDVRRGQKVAAGERIGTSGNTGRSHGAHLHFQVRSPKFNNQTVDPEPMLRGLIRRA